MSGSGPRYHRPLGNAILAVFVSRARLSPSRTRGQRHRGGHGIAARSTGSHRCTSGITGSDMADQPQADVMTFQGLILALQQYWAEQGCVVVQPLDMEVGAGTFHPSTFLRAIGPENWNSAYVQPSRRPTDGRYG